VRLQALDRPGVMATVSSIFGDLGISMEAILQKEPDEKSSDATEDVTVPIILLTGLVKEGLIDQAIEKIQNLDSVIKPVTRIRVETL